jgi:hypothetical protein
MASQPRDVVNRDNGRKPFDSLVRNLHSTNVQVSQIKVFRYHKPPFNGRVPIFLYPHSDLAAGRLPADLNPLTAEAVTPYQMPIRTRQLVIVLAVMLPAGVLGGCSTINTSLAGTGEALPTWLGGMPADAPPRPGTPKYDEFMKEQERKRLTPAPPKEEPAQSPSAGLTPVH